MEKTGDKNWQWYEAAATQWRGRGADRETQPELNAALDCAWVPFPGPSFLLSSKHLLDTYYIHT